jgi:hypothetical protein
MLVEVYQNVVAELKLLLDLWFRMLQGVEFDGSLHIELRVAVVIKLAAVQNYKNFLLPISKFLGHYKHDLLDRRQFCVFILILALLSIAELIICNSHSSHQVGEVLELPQYGVIDILFLDIWELEV